MNKKLSSSEIQKQLPTVSGWSLQGDHIQKDYKFSDFVAAMAFVNHIAGIAEAMDHHPDILLRYNKLHLELSTHSEGGLTDKDFTLARQIDA